jgi:hypothetical protein
MSDQQDDESVAPQDESTQVVVDLNSIPPLPDADDFNRAAQEAQREQMRQQFAASKPPDVDTRQAIGPFEFAHKQTSFQSDHDPSVFCVRDERGIGLGDVKLGGQQAPSQPGMSTSSAAFLGVKSSTETCIDTQTGKMGIGLGLSLGGESRQTDRIVATGGDALQIDKTTRAGVQVQYSNMDVPGKVDQGISAGLTADAKLKMTSTADDSEHSAAASLSVGPAMGFRRTSDGATDTYEVGTDLGSGKLKVGKEFGIGVEHEGMGIDYEGKSDSTSIDPAPGQDPSQAVCTSAPDDPTLFLDENPPGSDGTDTGDPNSCTATPSDDFLSPTSSGQDLTSTQQPSSFEAMSLLASPGIGGGHAGERGILSGGLDRDHSGHLIFNENAPRTLGSADHPRYVYDEHAAKTAGSGVHAWYEYDKDTPKSAVDSRGAAPDHSTDHLHHTAAAHQQAMDHLHQTEQAHQTATDHLHHTEQAHQTATDHLHHTEQVHQTATDHLHQTEQVHQAATDHLHQTEQVHQAATDHLHQTEQVHQTATDHLHQTEQVHQQATDHLHQTEQVHQTATDHLHQTEQVHQAATDHLHQTEQVHQQAVDLSTTPPRPTSRPWAIRSTLSTPPWNPKPIRDRPRPCCRKSTPC